MCNMQWGEYVLNTFGTWALKLFGTQHLDHVVTQKPVCHVHCLLFY